MTPNIYAWIYNQLIEKTQLSTYILIMIYNEQLLYLNIHGLYDNCIRPFYYNT